MKNISVVLFFLLALVGSTNRLVAQCADGTNCYLAIEGLDDYGDGWNGNMITFMQNGVTIGTFTLNDGSELYDTIRICTDNGPVTCSWSTGLYPYEVSFTITDSLGAVLYNCTSAGNMDNGLFATLSPCPSCPSPIALNASNITADGATIGWTEAGSAGGWYYCYGTSSTPSGPWISAVDNSVSLTGLQTNTRYWFFVYSDCGGEDTSTISSMVFRTACGELTLPYTEDFENVDDVEQIPYCWTRYEVAAYADWLGSTTYYPMVNNYEAHSGSSSFYFRHNYGTQSVISPRIPIPANTLELQMWIKGGEAVQVGYVTTTDSATAVFHQVAVVGPSNDTLIDFGDYSYTEYIWTKVTVRFNTVTTTDSVYVVLRAPSSIEYETLSIDDLIIRQINNCPQPEEVALTGTASGELSLAWIADGGSQWEVAYGPSGFNPDTATSTVVISNTPSVTLTDLDNSTLYDVYVRTVCGSQHSYWSEVFSTIPNVHIVTAARDTITSCDITIVDNGGVDGDFSLDLNQIIVLYPDSEGQTIHISGFAHLYNMYSSYSEDMNILRVFSGSDTNGILLANYNTVDVDNISLTSDMGAMTLWFHSGSYSGDENEGFQFSVSCVDRPSCTTPYGLTVSNISGTYAMVDWQYNNINGEAPGFTLTLLDTANEVVGSYSVAGNERSYILLDLDERTSYRLQLNVDCDGVDSLVADFTTVCNTGGETAIGTGTSTNSYLPAYLFASSSISQQIFTAAELSNVPVIDGFRIYMTSSSATPDRQWDVYLDTTSRSSYGGVNDYIVPTTANRYFSGSVSLSQGWVAVTFDSAFTVPAGMNVVLTVNDKTGTTGSSRSFRTTTTSDTMSLYGYTTSGIINATSGTDFASAMTNGLKRRNTIRLSGSCGTGGCLAPIIVGAVPEAHSVTLTWVSVGSETAWKVEYRAGTGAWTIATPSTNSTTYTVTGLAATTTYSFRVSSLCGSEESSPRIVSATTLCGEETVPFTENFEVFLASSYTDELTPCWYRGSDYQSTYDYYPARDSYYAHESSYSILMGGYRSFLVLPKMAAAIDSLSLSFYAINTYPDEFATLEVGVCTNPADSSTFTVVATYPVTDDDWVAIETDMENYAGADGYLFIRMQQDDYRSVYIDDIAVIRLPDCRRVNDVAVSNIGTSSVTLTVTDNHNYGNYILYYGINNDTALADTVSFSGTTYTLTGLTENTKYYMWLVASCAPGSTGRAFAIPAFRTLCLPIVVTDDVPFLDEFETGQLECFSQESSGGLKWTVVTGGMNLHSYSGSYMLSLASATNQEVMLVLPTFDFTAMSDNAHFSFYRYQNHYTGYATSVGSLKVYYRTNPTDAWALLATVDSNVNSWDRFSYELPSSQGAATYQLALKGNPMGNTSGIYVDDLMVSAAPSCPTPTDVAVRNISERSATVAWEGSAPAYRVQYRPTGALSWTTHTVEYNDSLNITPLEMATRYEVRVASVCSSYERSENSNIVAFVTDFCDNRLEGSNYAVGDVAAVSTVAPVNTTQGYSYAEMLVDSAVLAGMTEINGIAFDVETIGGAAYMTDCQLYMGHTSASIMSDFHYDSTYLKVFDGDMSTTATGLHRILFTTPFLWDGHGNVVLGVMYNTPDYNTHEATQFAAHQAATNKLYYGSSPYSYFTPDQAHSLSIVNCGASNVVPDITFYSCQPTCYEPVLSAVTTSANSITVDWYHENSIVQLQLKEAASSTWEEPVAVNGNETDVHSYTFTSLANQTTYTIRLRRDCTVEDMDYSDWVMFDVTTDTACSIPQNVTVSDIDATEVTVGWTDGAVTGGKWEIRIWNGHEEHLNEVATNPATVGGLTPGSTYQVAVRAYCCAYDQVVGEYSAAVPFNNVCGPVADLVAHRNGSDVTLTWQPGAYNSEWVYIYGYEGFEPNQSLGYGIVQEPTVTLSGLMDGQPYTFRVRSRCGDDWNSAWSSDVTVAPVAIDEVDGTTRFVLMPNPASDKVTLRIGSFEGNAQVSILSVDGRTVSTFATTEADLSLDVSSFTSGTYFVRVQTNGWMGVRKLVIK